MKMKHIFYKSRKRVALDKMKQNGANETKY